MKKAIWILSFAAAVLAAACAFFYFRAPASVPETVSVPILMYHHISEQPAENESTVTLSRFREQLEALRAAGYEPVDFPALRAYAEEGKALPPKPVVITFDDGYESNDTLARPLLEELDWTATVFPIGVSMGKDTYKDTGKPMLPHFSAARAAELEAGGCIAIESHGFDLHRVAGLDPQPVRFGLLPMEGEGEAEYRAFLAADHEAMCALLGKQPGVFAYPYGMYCDQSEAILRELGYYATVTTEARKNLLRLGEPDTLRLLGRYTVTEDLSGVALIAMLEE